MPSTSEIDFKNSLYVGCSLSTAPQKFRDEIGDFKARLRERLGITVHEFKGYRNGTPSEIYEYDRALVVNSTAFLAIFSKYVSGGLAQEVQIAAEHRIPMLGIAYGNRVGDMSYMTSGCFDSLDQPLHEVENLDDVPEMVFNSFTIVRNVLKLPQHATERGQ